MLTEKVDIVQITRIDLSLCWAWPSGPPPPPAGNGQLEARGPLIEAAALCKHGHCGQIKGGTPTARLRFIT